jgi:cytochrome c oxidase subunit 1/cytochrome c oxidase subunit I+III
VADAATIRRLEALWDTPPTLYGRLATLDHKIIGVRYIVTAIVFLCVGGIEALVMRLQLSRANAHLLTPETYDQLFTMHGITMILWYASPILSGFGNYFLPLLLGARDMAFPRLNAFSYWTYLCSGLFLYASAVIGQSPSGGWFAYVPLTTADYSPGLNMDFYALALNFLTVSTTVGAINFIVTILRMRAPGMAIERMPLLGYSTLTTSVLSVLALPGLTLACVFLELDRQWHTHFFDTSLGGDAILWQHLFWFWGHPWVYIVFLPATGMVSMILPVFARRPIVGYRWVAASTMLTGVVGMGVWVHHMFATGEPHMTMTLFSGASMVISIFTTIQVFAWIATLWCGTPVMSVPLAFILGFISLIVAGGLSGVATALIPLDWQVHDTYFVVAHLHYVLIGGNVFPVFAALYYWMPKMSGRMLGARAGYWSFWLMFIGFNGAFFPMHLTGLLGLRRRVFTFLPDALMERLNVAATVGAIVLAIGILITLINIVRSLRAGALAGPNPWNADTLEWDMPSPPPSYGAATVPTIDTLHPLWDAHDESADPSGERALDVARLAMATTWRDARPAGLSTMPEDTAAPLLLSLAITVVVSALLLKAVWVAGIGVVLTLAMAGYWLWPEPRKVPA